MTTVRITASVRHVRSGNGWVCNVIRAEVAASAPEYGSKGNATKEFLAADPRPPRPLHSRRLASLGARQEHEARARHDSDRDTRARAHAWEVGRLQQASPRD